MQSNGLTSKFLRNGQLFRSLSAQLEQSDFASRDELINMQNKKLRKLIEHAVRSVPYYTRLFKREGLLPSDIATIEDLWKIPLLTKDLLREHFDDLRSRKHPAFLLREVHTSGTTGNTTRFYRDLHSINFENATVWRQWRWAGVKPTDWMAVCRSVKVIPAEQSIPPFWITDKPQRQLMLSAYHMKEEWLSEYIGAMRDYGVSALQAYPSSALVLAQYLLSAGTTLPLKAVFTSSEPVYPHHRTIIEAAFECRIWDYYGMGERVVSGSECAMHDGLHINEEYGLLEILDENNKPASKGHIVGTNLNNFAMPLLRYTMDDLGSFMEIPCNCGRQGRKLHFIEARMSDVLLGQDGRPIPPTVLIQQFRKTRRLRKSKVIQHTLDYIEILVVPADEEFAKQERDILYQALVSLFGSNVSIVFTFVEDIPCEKSGKYRWVVSELNDKT
jgi:phenylacetate-CoA ligase